MDTYHIPVLLKESVDALNIVPNGVYCDATLGGGGHTREILSRLGSKGRLIVFDRDQDALINAPKDKRVILVHNNFRFIQNFVRFHKFEGVDGILADLGVSSHQFDTSHRGFSFRFDAELDMRMNSLIKKSAKNLINEYSIEELTKIFRLYGELDKPKKVADLIIQAREKKEICTTGDLREAIAKILPGFGEHKFLAKVYQALRMEVNGEMLSLEYFLKGALNALKPSGRLSVITYHSLEDRMVKNFIRSGNTSGEIEKDFFGNSQTQIKAINRKPILPSEEEIASNTRARSAKLRIAEKV